MIILKLDRLIQPTNFSHLTCAEMPQYHNSDTHTTTMLMILIWTYYMQLLGL